MWRWRAMLIWWHLASTGPWWRGVLWCWSLRFVPGSERVLSCAVPSCLWWTQWTNYGIFTRNTDAIYGDHMESGRDSSLHIIDCVTEEFVIRIEIYIVVWPWLMPNGRLFDIWPCCSWWFCLFWCHIYNMLISPTFFRMICRTALWFRVWSRRLSFFCLFLSWQFPWCSLT